MTIVISIAVASLLLGIFYINSFIKQTAKVSALQREGIITEGHIVEVRNDGLAQDANSSQAKISFRFTDLAGNKKVVNYKTQIAKGEVIGVGSPVTITYLESDPKVFNVSDLGIKAKASWLDLVTGISVIVVGLFIAYLVFLNMAETSQI